MQNEGYEPIMWEIKWYYMTRQLFPPVYVPAPFLRAEIEQRAASYWTSNSAATMPYKLKNSRILVRRRDYAYYYILYTVNPMSATKKKKKKL